MGNPKKSRIPSPKTTLTADRKSHLAVRTCVCCRSRKEKSGLIRLVLGNDQMVLRDDRGKTKGRGAYVCPEKACIAKLLDPGRLNRAFKKKGAFSVHPNIRPHENAILNGINRGSAPTGRRSAKIIVNANGSL